MPTQLPGSSELPGSSSRGRAQDSPLLKVEALSRHFPVFEGGLFRARTGVIRAVEQVSFELARGGSLAILGEPGAGKSTLARCLARLEDPNSGRIWLEGREVTRLRGGELRAYRHRVQYVYPNPRAALNLQRTVRELLDEPLEIAGAAGREAETRQTELSAALGLNEYLLRKRASALSTGLLQRVALARALILQPALLILDGPGECLENGALEALLADLETLRRTHDFAVIWTARRPEQVRRLADRVLVLYKGRAVEWGEADRVLHDPQHPYSRQWFGKPVAGSAQAQPYEQGCRYHPECPAVMPVCREQAPGMRKARPGQSVACFLYGSE